MIKGETFDWDCKMHRLSKFFYIHALRYFKATSRVLEKPCIKFEGFTGLQFKLAIILSYALQKMQNTKIYNSAERNANVDFRKIRCSDYFLANFTTKLVF